MANVRNGTRGSPILWALFGMRGRLSRQVYWLATFFWSFLNTALIWQLLGEELAGYAAIAEIVEPFVFIATIYSIVAVTVKRLHDADYSGMLVIGALIPFVSVFFTIWIGILPGTSGPNTYGDMADRVPT